MNPCISFSVASAMNKLNYVEFVRHLNVGTGDHNTISFAKKKVKSERSVNNDFLLCHSHLFTVLVY